MVLSFINDLENDSNKKLYLKKDKFKSYENGCCLLILSPLLGFGQMTKQDSVWLPFKKYDQQMVSLKKEQPDKASISIPVDIISLKT